AMAPAQMGKQEALKKFTTDLTEQARGGKMDPIGEFNLLPDLSVAENVLLNREPRRRFGLIDWKALNQRTRELMALLETNIDPETPVSELSVAQQQIVEIVKALAIDARLIIMDEPTAALNPVEVGHLFSVVERLKARGSAVIFISHRLDEVFHISEHITVLKDGQVVGSSPATDMNREEVVRLMVGRQLQDIFPPLARRTRETPILEANNLTTPRLRDVSFKMYPGEILGIAGLEGHGQRELARALFALEPMSRGELRLNGQPLRLRHPEDAISAGIVFISDDRKGDGLALPLAVRENVALPNLDIVSRFGFVSGQQERGIVSKVVEALSVRTPSIEQQVRLLSGGNQQKVVLSKWLVGTPKILVFVEPTRGIDVGAKVEIYRLMGELAREGASILMVSSDLLELLGMSGRVLVMREGAVTAELSAAEANEESIMRAATGTANG
ncbi:MAG: ATP-binding cassette domain-containing protein, partial [Burkholderiales bacterium]|nr:ATP-binding cassette domain-containing protein [Anaerolineae bacterium]